MVTECIVVSGCTSHGEQWLQFIDAGNHEKHGVCQAKTRRVFKIYPMVDLVKLQNTACACL